MGYSVNPPFATFDICVSRQLPVIVRTTPKILHELRNTDVAMIIILWPVTALEFEGNDYNIVIMTAVEFQWKRHLGSHTRYTSITMTSHDRHDVSNHRWLQCLSRSLCRRTSNKTSKLRAAGNSKAKPPISDGFPSQRASNVERVSM